MARSFCVRSCNLVRISCLGLTYFALGCSSTSLEEDQAGVADEAGGLVEQNAAVPTDTPESWHAVMAKSRLPAAGCFKAAYPSTSWQSVSCVRAPEIPFIPKTGSALQARTGAQTVGNGTDFLGNLSNISSAIGSFLSTFNVTSENDGGTADSYSLQLNSNFFSSSPACSGHSGCQAWQQFVYSNETSGSFIYMQYWLIGYGTCPSGWNTFGTDCWKNSSATTVPSQTITNLRTLKLTGTTVSGGQDQSSIFIGGTNTLFATGQDSVLTLNGNWNSSEFGIYGDGGGSAAVFNSNASLVVALHESNGGFTAPTCTSGGTTGETNNLSLVSSSCCTIAGPNPGIVFTQSNTGSTSLKPYCGQMALVPTFPLGR